MIHIHARGAYAAFAGDAMRSEQVNNGLLESRHKLSDSPVATA
jgi:hypothetical protein